MLYFNKYAYTKVYIWAHIYITDDGSIFHGAGQYSIIEKWPAGQFSMGVNILSDTGSISVGLDAKSTQTS